MTLPVIGSYFSSPPPPPPKEELSTQEQSAIDSAKDMMFLDTSLEKYLTWLGQNLGIKRSRHVTNDDVHRKIIQAIACPGPKTTLSTLYFLMEAVFGSQETLRTQSLRPWQIYQVRQMETIIEVPYDLLGTSNENTSYLHGWSGVVLDGATTTVFVCEGDARVAAVTLVGLGLSALVSGTYEERTIATVSYDAAADQTTFTVAAFSGAPVAGAPFFVNVPGDGTSSYRGDYVAPLWYVQGTSTATGENTLTDSGLALTVDQYAGYFLRLQEGAIYYPILSHTATVFTLGANGGTPPAGDYQVVASATDALEHADTPTTPPHDDRIYITGDDRLEIIKEYVGEILHAAGVVVRYVTV